MKGIKSLFSIFLISNIISSSELNLNIFINCHIHRSKQALIDCAKEIIKEEIHKFYFDEISRIETEYDENFLYFPKSKFDFTNGNFEFVCNSQIKIGSTFQVEKYFLKSENKYYAVKSLQELKYDKIDNDFLDEVIAFNIIQNGKECFPYLDSSGIIDLEDIKIGVNKQWEIDLLLIYPYEQITLETILKIGTRELSKYSNREVPKKRKISDGSLENINFVKLINDRENEGNIDPGKLDFYPIFRMDNHLFKHYKKIIHSLLKAVNFLEKIDMIHSDLKPNNITISCKTEELEKGDIIDKLKKCQISDLEVKIIDFDHFNRKVFLTRPIYISNGNYRAPESALGLPIDNGIDIWVIGIIAFELFIGQNWCSNTGDETYDNRKVLACIEERLDLKIEEYFDNDDENKISYACLNSTRVKIYFEENGKIYNSISFKEYLNIRERFYINNKVIASQTQSSKKLRLDPKSDENNSYRDEFDNKCRNHFENLEIYNKNELLDFNGNRLSFKENNYSGNNNCYSSKCSRSSNYCRSSCSCNSSNRSSSSSSLNNSDSSSSSSRSSCGSSENDLARSNNSNSTSCDGNSICRNFRGKCNDFSKYTSCNFCNNGRVNSCKFHSSNKGKNLRFEKEVTKLRRPWKEMIENEDLKDLKDLLSNIFTLNPNKRKKAGDLLDHRFFNDLII